MSYKKCPGGALTSPPRSLKEMLKQTPAFLPSPLLYQELSVVTFTVDAGIFLYQERRRRRRRAIMKVSLIRRATFNVIVSWMPNWLKLNRHLNLTRYLSLVKDSCYKYTYVTLWYYYDVGIYLPRYVNLKRYGPQSYSTKSKTNRTRFSSKLPFPGKFTPALKFTKTVYI